MNVLRFRVWAALLLLLLGPSSSLAQNNTSLDLRLVLAIDCSFSVDDREFALQMTGIAEAFRSKEVVDAIGQGKYRRIAVTLVQWSSPAAQFIAVPWTFIDGRESAALFAETVAATPRLTAEGGTSLSTALLFAGALLEENNDAERRVVDISADGRNNSGEEIQNARDALVARGITINGLAILDEIANLHRYFKKNVIGGKDFFVVEAKNYRHYAEAILRKLVMEISGLPVS
ncbi:MAG: DUF1194 domain-containing protein [Hyphomicrobiales bacterium]|nr:DUF1194 domain-containing protein [Hyphomicrobiales bacterium]MCY4033004.1 DUF1194 domain-containing protein [Hyphomicrobiales bacterium]